jgi:hypothetical protein
MNDWNIQSRAHACGACGKPFADQEVYHTLLSEERAELRRSDICSGCWQQQFSEGARDRKGFISYWQGVYEAPPPRTDAIQKETAETLLRKLVEQNDPRYVPAGYILAVMLERKRVLKVKEQILRDGKRTFIYEQPKTGDVFTITDPDLHLDQLEEVQRDVATLLEQGLNPPTTTATTTADPNAVAPANDSPSPAGEGGSEGEPAPAAAPQPATT